jgi:hypothetical protein
MIVLTGIILSALLVGSLGVVNVVSEVRRLRVGGAPRPWFVVCRRIRGTLPTFYAAGRQDLENRAAWLSWDLRRVTVGETSCSHHRSYSRYTGGLARARGTDRLGRRRPDTSGPLAKCSVQGSVKVPLPKGREAFAIVYLLSAICYWSNVFWSFK